MEAVDFAVLALGDQDFDNFCQAGKDFDHILGELGGNRIAPRVDCDFDFEETAEQWMDKMLEVLNAIDPVDGDKTANDADSADKTDENVADESTDNESVGKSKETATTDATANDKMKRLQPTQQMRLYMTPTVQLVSSLKLQKIQ